MAARRDKFEIYVDECGQWRWRRKAPNGKLVGAACEGFKSKQDCEANMLRGPKLQDKWEFIQEPCNEWRWRRKSANGKVVGASCVSFNSKKDAQMNAERQGYRP